MKVKTTRNFWLFIVLGALLLIFGDMLVPHWDLITEDWVFWNKWGVTIVAFVMAAVILFYIFAYLLPRLTKERGVIQVLAIIEFVLMFLIALGLVFSQFNILNIPDNPAFILGLALYCRGVIEVFRAYFHQRSSKASYPLWMVFVTVILVTVGVLLMCGKIFNITKELIAMVIAISVMIAGIVFIVYGIMAKPKANKAIGKGNPKARKS